MNDCNMHSKIKKIKSLKKGWFDNLLDGESFREEDLNIVSAIANKIEELGLVQYIYPHPDNSISIEFDHFKPEMVSIEFCFDSNEIYCHSLNLNTDECKTLLLNSNQLVLCLCWLETFMKKEVL